MYAASSYYVVDRNVSSAMVRCQRYVYVLVRDLQMFVREDVDGGAEAFRVFKRRRESDHALGAARAPRPACAHICAV